MLLKCGEIVMHLGSESVRIRVEVDYEEGGRADFSSGCSDDHCGPTPVGVIDSRRSYL